MKSNSSFVEELLRKVPELRSVYDEHLGDNGKLLPHVFMGDVTRLALSGAADTRNHLATLLAVLEDGLRTGSEEVRELIFASFVENLIGETEALKVLKPMMGLTHLISDHFGSNKDS